MELCGARSLLLRVLIGCLAAAIAAAQTYAPAQLKVFRGTLVHSRVPARMEVLEDQLLGMDESNNGRIVFVRPASQLASLAQQYGFDQNGVVMLTDSQFIMPGLVDCHLHSSLYSVSGVVEESLFTLINAELAFRNATVAREVSTKLIRRTLQHGSTTVVHLGSIMSDSNFILAQVAGELGQRAFIQGSLIDFLPSGAPVPPSLLHPSSQHLVNDSRRLIELIRGLQNPLIQPTIGPESSVGTGSGTGTTANALQGLGQIVRDDTNNILVQAHFGIEGDFEPSNTTLLEWIDYGVVPVNRTLIHTVNLRESEMEIFRDRGIAVAHTPYSDILFSGILDVRRLFNLGINVCLGTFNGPESVFSILEEMRVAQTASRALSRNLTMDLPPDYTPLSLAEVFYMATMGGAKAIRLGDTIGNFEVGKQFDALLVDTSAPVFDTFATNTKRQMIEKFLYQGDEGNIMKVYVAGRDVTPTTSTPTTPTCSAPGISMNPLSLAMGVVLAVAVLLI